MPPQQSHGLLDRFDEGFGFGAHERIITRQRRRSKARDRHLEDREGRNKPNRDPLDIAPKK